MDEDAVEIAVGEGNITDDRGSVDDDNVTDGYIDDSEGCEHCVDMGSCLV